MNNVDRKEWFESSIESLLQSWNLPAGTGMDQLKEAIAYSLSKGGKRFRPILALLIAENFAVHPQSVLPWATAVEMIHTYSLIHDDLPCMDNDDFRRGEPTNHKVFGETTALLAGDALLTEAFVVISGAYKDNPGVGLQLVSLLSQAAGIRGMVGGQAIDLEFQKKTPQFNEMREMHLLKTGALIRVSAEGAALICGLPTEKIKICREFGELLGLAFQVKDDLLDSLEKMELGSFPALLGPKETELFLKEISDQALTNLSKLGVNQGSLFDLVHFNLNRQK